MYIKRLILFTLLLTTTTWSQNKQIHLFQNFLKDSPVSQSTYGEAGLKYGDFDGGSIFDLGIQGAFPINNQLEIGTQWYFRNIDPEVGDGESGLTDITVLGKYNFEPGRTNISAGAYFTLPVGNEDIFEGNLDIGFFGSLRHPVGNGLTLTGLLGFNFIEFTSRNRFGDETSDRELSLNLGGGLIIPLNMRLATVMELNVETETDEALLSGAIDYSLGNGNHLRGGIGLGLDDGSPDFALLISFLTNF